MAAFLGDIAFLLGIVVAAAGLFTLHRAGTDPRPAFLKVAGIVLLLSGAGSAGCTAYYYFKYHRAGDLEHPYPVSAADMSKMMGKGGRIGMKRMLGDDLKPDRPRTRAMNGEAAPAVPDLSGEKHEAHHPESAGDAAE